MGINKRICPVCGEEMLDVRSEKLFGITVSYEIRCRYCCYHASATTKKKAYKKLWKNTLGEEELRCLPCDTKRKTPMAKRNLRD